MGISGKQPHSTYLVPLEHENVFAGWVSSVSYPQSATRQLAFGNPSAHTAVPKVKEPTNDFYNNATLSLIAKVFSLAVIVIATIMIVRLLEKSLLGSGLERPHDNSSLL
ncbi:unnamed protein product [Gongylonema pulchrum]|uniref:Col_cuticle_N domain-containing protein n=1 Tax=Gongylonema pulchrum TaxID=637853 RepID=A0A183D3Y6_9BILA|nr:unnamed protein product [Gongylonema pulchrum]